jgi:putative DNA primase/helicase
LTFDSAALSAFLDIFLDPSRGCAEIRVLEASIDSRTNRVVPHDVFQSTIAVWGDDPAHLVHEAARIRGISAYLTVNPVNPALKARADRLKKARATTRDDDIVCLRWLYLDFDVERPDGISSTEVERQAALERLWKVHAEHPELVPSAIWGCSGNGYWMLVLLPSYPNDEEHRGLIARVVDWFREQYSDDVVTIDEKCKNPARVMPLVGTMKCKGVSDPDRPHRLATIESPPDRTLTPLDLKAWAAIHLPAAPPDVQQANGQAHAPDVQQAGPRIASSLEKRVIAYLARIEPAKSGERGHNKTFGAACRVGPGFDIPEDEAFRLIKAHYNPRCEPPWTDKQLRHKLADAYKKVKVRGKLLNPRPNRPRGQTATATGANQPAATRPALEVTTERHIVVEETIKALGQDPDVFQRGGSLGIIIQESGEVAKLTAGIELRNAGGSSRFLPLTEPNVGCYLTRNATFFNWRKDGDGNDLAIDIHPPNWLIKSVATRGHWPGIRHLVSIAECPFIRPDGSMPSPGYDPATGILYRPSIQLPALPRRPTQADAQAARDRLNELVIQFPFATGYDWSVWLSALLTAIQRPAIAGPVPGIAFNGNKPGIGKGLLIDCIGIIVLGHSIPTRTYPAIPAEAAKIKLALALAGVAAVHFDDLPEGGFYGSSELDSALTSTVISDRILGQSRDSGPVPLRPVWMLSGNNVSPSRHAFRRWLLCNLVTLLENPHERPDITVANLRQHTADLRVELLYDALVILKAHALAGRPTGGWAPLGSFEEWDQIIRGAVWFVTGNDCLHTQREAAKDSPERLDKLALLEGWAQLPEGDGTGKGLTVDAAISLATGSPVQFAMLHGAVMKLLGKDGKTPSGSRVGCRIRSLQQNVGGFQFQRCGEENHSTLWRVIKI